MRNPKETSGTITVQRKLAYANELLYNETRNEDTEVRLGIADDRIFVICFSNGIETVIYECYTCKHLYKILDTIISDVMYRCGESKMWWRWNDPQYDDN